jgi:hypothetical protein
VYRLTDKNDIVHEAYTSEVDSMPKHQDQADCETFEELVNLFTVRAGGKPKSDKKPNKNGLPDDQQGNGDARNKSDYDEDTQPRDDR